MKVSFIIPLYNCLPLTQAMLASLQATLPAGLAHEVIFVDDGSTDGTREWLGKLSAPCRALLNDKNLGFAATCNRGAGTATGEFLFFLNNDLVLLPHWLEPMLAAFARHPRAGLVGNVQLNHATGAVDHTGIVFNCKGKPEHDTSRGPGLLHARPVAALTGACFGIRRATWQQLRGFDEGYVNGCEDVDLCFRARHEGHVNYVARRSVVRHHISASLGRKLRDEQNTARLVQRWRHVIARHAALDWCRHYLSLEWEEPRDYSDPLLARDCFLHRCRLLPRPTPRILLGVHTAIEAELARWRELAS
ncbi:MAG TPA: glycosyltransferase family 2 protein [Lacunisphaera sp.]|nr:glycosyltransferase family 2 protein [Lacunisphaera sp.]